MQIYSLNYFLAHKMLMRSILGQIFGVCICLIPYSTIVNHKKIANSIFILMYFIIFGISYVFFFFYFCFVLFFSMKIVADHFFNHN